MPADPATAAPTVETADTRGGTPADALARAAARTDDGDLRQWVACLLADERDAEDEQRDDVTRDRTRP